MITIEKIRVPYSNVGYREYTPEQLQKELDRLEFMRDAVLYLLNPELANNSDLPISTSRESILRGLRAVYRDTNYSQDFVDKFFNQ
jgi:hypothetical protein